MKTILTILFLCVAAALTGCYGATDPTGGSSYALVETTPLPSVPRSIWTVAPAGCEGRLDAANAFGVADGEPGLIAVLGADGSVVCVDTLESVDVDLRDRGEASTADELCARYLMVIDGIDGLRQESSSVRPREGDPSPQPNMAGSVTIDDDKGDPSPQPNLQGTAGSEGDDSDGGSATSSTGTTGTPRSQAPREGDPSPQPNNQAGSMTPPMGGTSSTTTSSSSSS